jgi:titin
MPFTVPSRRVAALAVAASGLTAVLAGAFAPAASATTPSTPAVSTVVAKKADWFVDPRTPAERRAEIAVPKNPKQYRGKVRETRAVYRTRSGDLAVPMRYAIGNKVGDGQAVTLDGEGLFVVNTVRLTPSAKTQLRGLAEAFGDAAAVRCEGYADYAGTAARNVILARGRANAVCDYLADENADLKTSAIGYGPKWPAVVGGDSEDRRLNRRVVVEVTNARPVTPPAPVVPEVPAVPQAKVPGAPILKDIHAGPRGTITYSYTAPTDDGGSPITGYEVSYGDGWAPVVSQLPARNSAACLISCDDDTSLYGILLDLAGGRQVDLQVRAVNKVGAGAPSNTLQAQVQGEPTAPAFDTWIGDNGVIATTFDAPETNGGSAITGYQVAYDGGTPYDLDLDLTAPGPYSSSHEGFANGTTHAVQVRARNQWAWGPWSDAIQVLVATVPDAPWLTQPELDGTTASFALEKPEFDGGSPVTSYEITTDGGETWKTLVLSATQTGMTFDLTDLVLGHEYDVRVRAVNARGEGETTKSSVFTPIMAPGAPSDVAATVDGTSVTVDFDAPTFIGGSEVTHYEVSVDGGEWGPVEVSSGAFSFTLGNQAAGFHTYAVRAVNAAGPGASETSQEVEVVIEPVIEPEASTITSWEHFVNGVGLYWNAGNPGTATFVRWEISVDEGPWTAFDGVFDMGEGAHNGIIQVDCPSDCSTYLRSARVRAVTETGASEPSAAFANDRMNPGIPGGDPAALPDGNRVDGEI